MIGTPGGANIVYDKFSPPKATFDSMPPSCEGHGGSPGDAQAAALAVEHNFAGLQFPVSVAARSGTLRA